MRKNATLGVIIILIGVVWLLSNLDIFSFSVIDVFFRSLGKLWPLLLIGIGINILLKENIILRLLVWLIILAAVMLYGIVTLNTDNLNNNHVAPNYDYSETHDYSLSKEEGTEEGILNLGFGAGDFRLASTGANLLEVKSNIPDLKYDHRFQNGNKKAVIDFNKTKYTWQGNHDKLFCYMNLDQDIIWEMDLDLGAAKGNLDVKDLAVRKISLDVGAADIDLFLGNKNKGQTEIAINAGASNLEINLPKEAGLKIKLDSALSGNNISELGLDKKGDYHISPDYDNKEVKFLFDVGMGVGNLKFHQQ